MTIKNNLKHCYTGSKGLLYHQRKHSFDVQVVEIVSQVRAAKIQPYIHGDDTVLEFGVGTGLNLIHLHCARRVGYDLSEAGKTLCETNGIQFTNDLKSLEGERFSAVICHHVLEHVPDVFDVIENIKKLLKPGGKLLLFVPFETNRRYRRYQPNDPDMHLYSWNLQSLGNLVTFCEFEIQLIKINPFGYEQYLAFLAKFHFRIYKAGLNIVRALRPANEIFVLAFKR